MTAEPYVQRDDLPALVLAHWRGRAVAKIPARHARYALRIAEALTRPGNSRLLTAIEVWSRGDLIVRYVPQGDEWRIVPVPVAKS